MHRLGPDPCRLLVAVLLAAGLMFCSRSRPPNDPAVPGGPTAGYPDSVYAFTTITTDPDGDGVCYRFDWGSGDTSEWSEWVASGTPAAMSYGWADSGTYDIRAQAKDANEAVSGWSGTREMTIAAVVPNRPTEPTLTPPTGNAYQNAEYALRMVSTQPQNRNLKYVVDWGDGRIDTTAADYPAGVEAIVRHTWTDPGRYQVKALAFIADAPELASDWSEPLSVTVEANEPPTDVTIVFAPATAPRDRDIRLGARANDPEGDSIAFQFHFRPDGDESGTTGDWTEPLVPSGATVEYYHQFRALGMHWVKARARDKWGAVSDWSDSLTVLVDTVGVVAWTWVTPDDDKGPAIGSALVLTGNGREAVYIGAEDQHGRFYSINTGTGRDDARSAGTDEDWFTGHPAYVAATGNIVVGNENGEIYAFSPDLSQQWRWPDSSLQWVDHIEWGVPAINGNRIYATRADDRVYYLTDLDNRGTYNSHQSIPGIKGNPVIDHTGNVFVISDRGRLYKFDHNLQPVWDTLLNQDNHGLNPPALGAAGHIYLGDIAGNVYAIAPDHRLRWRVTLEGGANHIVVGDDALFVVTGTGRVYRLSPETGATVWQRTISGAAGIETSPIITANGMLYVHDEMDVLHCIRQADGSHVWLVNCSDHAPARNRITRRHRDFRSPESSPAVTGAGDIVVVGLDALYLVAGYSEGTLAPTAWPKWQGGMYNDGKGGF